MSGRLLSIIGSLSLVALFSCVDWSEYTVDQVNLNPTVALPLVQGKFSVNDLLDKADADVIKVYPDGLVYFAYTTDMETGAIGDMFSLPDKAVTLSFALPGGTLPPSSQDMASDSISQALDFAMAPERIDEVGLLLGELDYATTSSASNLDYEVRVSLPGFVSKTQVPLNTGVHGTGSIDLDEYSIIMDDNIFQIKIVLILKKRPNPVLIPPGTTINVQLTLKGFQFRYLKGFLGEQTTSLPESGVEMGDFGALFNGAVISLAQPKVTLTITNEYGLPFEGDFVILEARKEGAQPLPILLNPPSPVTVNHPAIMGASAETIVSVTNINELLGYAPTSIAFQASATINKGLTDGVNFLVDTSSVKMKLDIEVPLYGSATGISIQDTLDVDLSQTEGAEIAKASLKLKISNQLPLDGLVQFILLDDNNLPIEVLLDDDQMAIIHGSTVDASGNLVTAGVYDGMIELSQDKVDKVFDASHLVVVLNFQTSRDSSGNAQDVKFKADYTVEIEAGILADLKLKTEIK